MEAKPFGDAATPTLTPADEADDEAGRARSASTTPASTSGSSTRDRSASTPGGNPGAGGHLGGSDRKYMDESSRDGGAMRRVESLEKLAPELGQRSDSFEKKRLVRRTRHRHPT